LGVRGMLGNAAEWTADWYGSYSAEPQIDPVGPKDGIDPVVRGFENVSTEGPYNPFTRRIAWFPSGKCETIGFRCAVEASFGKESAASDSLPSPADSQDPAPPSSSSKQ